MDDNTFRSDEAASMDALRVLVRELRASARAVELAVGLSGAQLFVLRQIAAEPGLSLNDLARRTHTHQSTVSTVVRGLVERGLTERVTAPDDARRLALSLTRDGHALVHRAPPTVQDALVAGLAALAPVQRRALADGLQAWIAAAGLAGAPPSLFFEGDAPAEPPNARRPRRTPASRP
jgi:DNA-binding MarR family transcriptional regulator